MNDSPDQGYNHEEGVLQTHILDLGAWMPRGCIMLMQVFNNVFAGAAARGSVNIKPCQFFQAFLPFHINRTHSFVSSLLAHPFLLSITFVSSHLLSFTSIMVTNRLILLLHIELPPLKRRRGLAGSIISTAVSAALIGSAVGLTVYRL